MKLKGFRVLAGLGIEARPFPLSLRVSAIMSLNIFAGVEMGKGIK